MLGQRVFNLRQLRQAVQEKRGVIVPTSHAWRKPKPAAVLINQSGTVLLQLFYLGMFIYEKDSPIIDAEFKPKQNKETHNGKE